MRRLFLLALPFSALVFSCLLSPALAAGDDDIPGTPFTVGDSISGTVNSGDVDDVYAVVLTAGEEVHILCDPGSASGNKGSFKLLAPGVSSVSDADDYVGMYNSLSGGSFLRLGVDTNYIPAKSGTYYLLVRWTEGALNYSLSVTRTARPALNLAPDSNNIPGTPMGLGAVTGVVSTNVDEYDVYAVGLTASRPVMIRLTALTSGLGYIELLDPSTPSISSRYSHRLGERIGTVSTDTADIYYTPTQTGTYYVLVECGGFLFAENFPYQLSISETGGGGGDGFVDVDGSPYETAIYDLAEREIITGYEDGTFRPNSPVTRQQFAKMIVKALGLTVTGTEMCPFTDVAARVGTDPLYPAKYVAVCAANGITTGKTTTTFAPNDNITHQQLITMVVRAAALDEPPADYSPPFTASQFSLEEHYQNARKAMYAGLLDGLEGISSYYSFLSDSTRGECAQILHNLLHME